MFKVWQIFIFSLVPLALVFMGVIVGSMHGVDSEKEILPTPPPPSASSPAPGGGSGGGGPAITLVASNLSYDKKSLSATANTDAVVRLDNKDASVQHNFSIYNNSSASTKIFVGDFVTGPAVKDYTVKMPAAGSYYFRCDVHPDQMNGTLIVR